MYAFEPNDEQKMLIDTISRYATGNLRPAAHDAEEAHALPAALVERTMARTIPIFEALVRADPKWHAYHGQLGYALKDQAGAVRAYRKALSLGNTASLPGLYKAAGVKFAFGAGELAEAVALVERAIAELHSGQ